MAPEDRRGSQGEPARGSPSPDRRGSQGEPARGSPSPAGAIRRATFLLVALAALAVEVAAADTRPVLQSLGRALPWVAAAAVLARLAPVPADPRRKPPGWVLLLVLGAAFAPMSVEPYTRKWAGEGYPLELQMVCGLRNVGLVLAACAGWLLCLRTAAVVSLFLVLFSAAMTNHPAVLALFGVYAAAGSAWLVLVYWTGLRVAFVDAERAVAVEVEPAPMKLPVAGLLLLLLAVGGGVAVAVAGPKRATAALGELMPTSGGTGETDPFARYGVGDGPEETAGDDARTAGMVETDKMIEDNKNSLVDVVSDTYGAPHKPPKEQERMVAGGLAEVIKTDGRPPDSRRPSRDFDTSRKGPKGDKKLDDRLARGLFEVEGRTPLHVRRVAYDRYDPDARRWVEGRKPANALFEPDRDGGEWMRVGHLRDAADWYAADERHRLKAATLATNLVPAPPLLTRFRISRVNRPDYYAWDYDGVLTLAGRRKTPPGVIVHTECRTLAPERLPEEAFACPGAGGGAPPALYAVPDALRPDVARLAREWAGDRPRGWPQVDAILTKLRTEYAHDHDAVPPADHPAPVMWLLLESRRGPDYLFATAAALLLRALDYPARVCLGYYASPDAYDRDTGHTPVKESDLHVWPEVLLRDGHWLVVEPTPGYDVLAPQLPLSERALAAFVAVGAWAGRNAVALALAVVVIGTVVARRRQLTDAVAVRLWRLRPGATWREQVLRAARLLERRGRWAGTPRPPGRTLAAWVRSVPPDAELTRFAQLVESAAYAPDPHDPPADAPAVCRRVLDAWTVPRLRAAVAPPVTGADS